METRSILLIQSKLLPARIAPILETTHNQVDASHMNGQYVASSESLVTVITSHGGQAEQLMNYRYVTSHAFEVAKFSIARVAVEVVFHILM